VTAMQNALTLSNADFGDLYSQLNDLREAFALLNEQMVGDRSKAEVGALGRATIWDRYNVASTGVSNSTYGPTTLHRENLEIAMEEHEVIREEVEVLLNEKIPALEKELEASGAPWIQGQALPEK